MVAEASDERQHYQRDTDCDVLMKCVRRGISFTTDMRQGVDIPVTKTTPTITLGVVAVSLSLNPKSQGAVISSRAASGSIPGAPLTEAVRVGLHSFPCSLDRVLLRVRGGQASRIDARVRTHDECSERDLGCDRGGYRSRACAAWPRD